MTRNNSASKVESSNSGNNNLKYRKKTLHRSNAITFLMRLIASIVIMAAISCMATIMINLYMVQSTRGNIVVDAQQAAEELPSADCIIILGASVRPDGNPSMMLKDRLDKGIELYNSGVAPKLLMSGDNGTEIYNEVAAMKKYAINAGVPAEDIFSDHAGFSTYESMYRLHKIFGCDSTIIVTQRYHLYRALYISKKLGIDARGAATADIRYSGQCMRDMRELAARNKDFLTCIFKPLPTYLGDPISIEGDGNNT